MSRKIIILTLLLLCCSGCITMRELTLPGTYESKYDFVAYSVTPLENPDWRLKLHNKETQKVIFINAKNYSFLFFEMLPTSKEVFPKDTDIIQYFQDKSLKEFELSPDITLSEQSFQKSETKIGKKAFKILTVSYEVTKTKAQYELAVYYYFHPQSEILYAFATLIDKKKVKKAADREAVKNDFLTIIERVKFKIPKEDKIIELRVASAFSDFTDSAQDKYLKEKFAEIKRKYDHALRLVNKWLQLKSDNYTGYNYLGYLSTYNKKFERYGEGAALSQAEEYFKKAVAIRKYFKAPHLNLAELYKNTDRVDKAIEEYIFLTKLSPNDDDVYYELSKLYEEKNDKENAKKYYEQAIRHWSGAAETLKELKDKLKQWEKSP